ncbi:ABC-2 family transporter protein [compost metagenome]
MMTIAFLTMLEQWRQRTPWGFLIVGAIMALPALLPVDGMHVNGAQMQGMGILDGLLGFAQFVAVFLTIATASGLVANDRERGTLLLLITKPLPRYQVLLGKLAGACAFMLLVWLGWGAIAALALGFKFGSAIMVPTLTGFAASCLTSWLLIAFCLFWSCFLPANSTMGLGVLGWLAATIAPKIAMAANTWGKPIAARTFEGLHWALPTDVLSDAAKQLAAGESPERAAYAAILAIVAWWLASTLVFSQRDLAPRD